MHHQTQFPSASGWISPQNDLIKNNTIYFCCFCFLSFTSVFSLPLPRKWGSTAAFRSWDSAAGRRSLGLWVCGAVYTCCRAPPPLWPRDQCCGKTRFASSFHGHRSSSTVSQRKSHETQKSTQEGCHFKKQGVKEHTYNTFQHTVT